MRFGLVTPHFGAGASRQRLLDGARAAERLGYDSLWVRDHLVFEPHGFEGDDPTWIDPFMALAYLAGATERIGFGTGTLIPFRHPLHLAGSVESLAWLGERHIDLGVGGGGFSHEFELLGMGDVDRPALMREHVRIARAVWAGLTPPAGEGDGFGDVRMEPRPTRQPMVWFGGSSPRAARLAAEFCDGYLPGRITYPTWVKRREAIAEARANAGLPDIRQGAVPIVSIGSTREEALTHVPVEGLIKGANRFWVKPPSGAFETFEDLAGSVIAGTADDIREGVERYRELGCEMLVIDLRFRFDDWVEQIEAVAAAIDVGSGAAAA